ncbi:hypothetical protein ACVINW_000145 [Bradyrhizobium sp. USDA 4461]
MTGPACILCDNTGWVCENHPDQPWTGNHACWCGGAGAPYPQCNKPDNGDIPQLSRGIRSMFEKRNRERR